MNQRDKFFLLFYLALKLHSKKTQTLNNGSNTMADKGVKNDEDQINKLKSDLEAERREREKAEQAVSKFKQDEGIRTQKEQKAEFKTIYEDLIKQGMVSY
jgi:hypothetical protein